MSIYVTPVLDHHPFADEAGVDMCIHAGPPKTHDPGDIVLIFWAMQMSWRQPNGASAGGGHLGLLWQDNPAATRYGRINYGVYDDYIGNYAVFRGSKPTDPRFVQVGTQINSYGFDWSYGDTYRFRIFRSPRQDWTAAELDAGDQQVPPYVNSDQQPDEVAYRVTVQNITRHEVPAVLRDILIRGAVESPALSGLSCWTEVYTPQGFGYGGDVTFSNMVWDGARVVKKAGLTYHSGAPITTNCFLDGGGIRQLTNATRTVPDGTEVTIPTSHWPTPQPNVAPNPVAATPQPTPRPWF